jgi:exopolyphosphatase/guanosine-5'-triphosphate,3'-diphosphate pyrophosphatase
MIARRDGHGLIRLVSEREVMRLGKNLVPTGMLNKNNIDLSIRSITKFKAICDSYNVQKIHIVGTGALREARDSASFVKKVRQISGLNLEIISGETEAELTLAGITNLYEAVNTTASVLAVDVGGGSTELMVAGDSNLIFSIPIGALKLHERFVCGDPPSLSVLRNMKTYILTEIDPAMSRITEGLSFKEARNLIVTGGTATNLAAINLGMPNYDGDKVHGCGLDYSAIKLIFDRLVSLPLKDRYNIAGLERERADIIVPGTMIIMSIMESLGIKELTVSDYGLMEGIVLSNH